MRQIKPAEALTMKTKAKETNEQEIYRSSSGVSADKVARCESVMSDEGRSNTRKTGQTLNTESQSS